MKVLPTLLPLLLLVISVSADKRIRPQFFQRQSSSTEKPGNGNGGPYPPSGWKPEKPQTSTESSGPYPPSGWKPDGPQFEVPPPPQKPDGSGSSSTPAPDSETDSQSPSATDAPAKLVSFVKPENIYYVLPNGKLQQLVVAPQSATLLASAPYRQVDVPRTRPLELQIVEVQQQPHVDFVYNSPLVRVLRKS